MTITTDNTVFHYNGDKEVFTDLANRVEAAIGYFNSLTRLNRSRIQTELNVFN